ncbi:Uncharacterised protein [uncultured archaeon]|nr:Uncharacterised protein [uncultured archaeon]
MFVFQFKQPGKNTTQSILTQEQREQFLGNGTYYGASNAFADAASKHFTQGLIFTFTQRWFEQEPQSLLAGNMIEVNLGKPFTSGNAKKAYQATLDYVKATLDDLKTYLETNFKLGISVSEMHDSNGRLVGYRLLSTQTTEDMEKSIATALGGSAPAPPAPTQQPQNTGGSQTQPTQGGSSIVGGIKPGTNLSGPQGSQTGLGQRNSDIALLNTRLLELESASLDDFTTASQQFDAIQAIDQRIWNNLRGLYPNDANSRNAAYQKIWDDVLAGADDSSTVKQAFKNGVDKNSASFIYNRMAAITLINEVDNQLYKMLAQKYSTTTDPITGMQTTETDQSVRDAISAYLVQIRKTGMSDAAAQQLFGRNGEALDAFIEQMNLNHILISTTGKPLTVADKYELVVQYLSNNMDSARAAWQNFQARFPQSSATITTMPQIVTISDDVWSKMGSPLNTTDANGNVVNKKPDRRNSYDIFTSLSFAHGLDDLSASAKVSDTFLLAILGQVTYDPVLGYTVTPSTLSQLPPHASMIFAANPSIMTGVLTDGATLDRAVARIKIGLGDMQTIYNRSGPDYRFEDMADYAKNTWAPMVAKGDVFSELRRSTIKGTEYGQIEITDPRVELFQTYGAAGSTFAVGNMMARYRLGSMLFMNRPVYGMQGAGYYDDLRATRDYNAYQRDLTTATLPYSYIATSYWSPPPLYLRVDESAYISQLYAGMQTILRKRADYTNRIARIGGAIQHSSAPDISQTDFGTYMQGSKWGQAAMMSGSTSSQDFKDKDGQKYADASAQQFRLYGQNLQTQSVGVYHAFADWLATQANQMTVIAGNPATLNNVGETLVLGTGNVMGASTAGSSNMTITNTGTAAPTLNTGLYIGDANILIGGYHHYDKTQTESGTGISTVANGQDDFGAYFLLNGFWYRLDFHGRMKQDVIDYLNNNAPQVNADDALTHTYQESSNAVGSPWRVNAGLETHQETEKETNTSIPGEGSLTGYFAGFQAPSNTAVIAARTIENDWAAGIAQLFGSVTDGDLLVVRARRLPLSTVQLGTYGTYGTTYNQPGRGPRAYKFGEEQSRLNNNALPITFADVVFQGMNQYRINAFAGVTDLGEQGSAGASYVDQTLGGGLYYTFRKVTDAKGNTTNEPAEVFAGFGSRGTFMSWPSSITGFYYENDTGGRQLKQFGWSTAMQLSDDVTLFSNALFNPDVKAGYFTPKGLADMTKQVGALGQNVLNGQAAFKSDYNQRISLSKQWGQGLLDLHNQVMNWLPTDEQGASLAQFSLGVRARSGLFTQVSWSQTEDGGLVSGLFMPSENLAFFGQAVSDKQALGGFKVADGNVGVTGLYTKADSKDIYAVQVAVRDAFGASLMTSPDHDYYRASLLIGGRPANMMLDFSRMGDFLGYGALGTIYGVGGNFLPGLDLAAGFSRQELMNGPALNATTLNGSLYYTTASQNLMLEVSYGATYVSTSPDNWSVWRLGLHYRP